MLFSRKSREADTAEDEKMARLVKAETELDSLKDRASRATSSLMERRGRNHWRESIQEMIQGGI